MRKKRPIVELKKAETYVSGRIVTAETNKEILKIQKQIRK